MSNQEVSSGRTCPTCATMATPGAAFCRMCGTSLGGSGGPPVGGDVRASSVPPPPVPMPPPPPGQPISWGAVGPDGRVVPQQNGYAIASLVLGLVGLSSLLCGASVILSILAVIFGIIGRKKASQGLSTSGGLATAGLILGVIGVVVVGAAIVFMLVSSGF